VRGGGIRRAVRNGQVARAPQNPRRASRKHRTMDHMVRPIL